MQNIQTRTENLNFPILETPYIFLTPRMTGLQGMSLLQLSQMGSLDAIQHVNPRDPRIPQTAA